MNQCSTKFLDISMYWLTYFDRIKTVDTEFVVKYEYFDSFTM